MHKQLFRVRHQNACIALVVSVFALFSFAGCTQQPTVPDAAGMSPYEAKQLLEQDVADAQVSFVTIKGTKVAVESSEHYSGWEVVATEPSAKTSLNEEDSKEILITIQMTKLEAEKRDALIADHMRNEVVSGWPEGSITYYDSDEMLTLRYQGKGGPLEDDASGGSKLDGLAKNLNGTILATYYIDDNYLSAIRYYSHENAPSDQLGRAEEETARIVKEADLYAAQHLDSYIGSVIKERFAPDFGDPPMYKSSGYALTDTGVVITVVLGDRYSFKPTNGVAAFTMDELSNNYKNGASVLSQFTQTSVRFEIYSSSGDLELAVASEGSGGYDVWNQTEAEPFFPL